MKIIRLLSILSMTVGLILSGVNAFAQGSGGPADNIMVTRHFTGVWDQPNQESQGLTLEVIEQLDGSRRAVAYWFTYGADRQSAWILGIGDLVDNRIEFALYESRDVGFMQNNLPGDDSVHSIGTMTMVFDSCDSGNATFETDDANIGSGSFEIHRIAEIMNTHCSGGISDDMHADAMFSEQRMILTSAREGVAGDGHARYEDHPGHMEFDIDVNGLADGEYHLYVGGQDRGVLSVTDGHGEMEFRSPGETGTMLMNFDPRDMLVEIRDDQGVVLSSFENRFAQDEHDHYGSDDHHYDCESRGMGGGGMGGGGMGGGMHECVNEGEYIGIEADLVNTGALPDAKGDAEWKMNTDRVVFSVEIEDVPAGSYKLKVGGTEVGTINAFQMHDGEVYGRISFRDPAASGIATLDFEPRGQQIEVLQGDDVILEVNFPTD